jgi:hypothetical protein
MSYATQSTTQTTSAVRIIPRELWAIYLHRGNILVGPEDAGCEDAIMTWTTAAAADDALRSMLASDVLTGDSRPMVVRVK